MVLPTQIEHRLKRLGILLAEVEETFIRGSGPGGQKINKTSSTVVLRHRPSGVEVRSQAGRSQAANREEAWSRLCERIEANQSAAKAAVRDERERERRRARGKSPAQKRRMVADKRHRSSVKGTRGRVGAD